MKTKKHINPPVFLTAATGRTAAIRSLTILPERGRDLQNVKKKTTTNVADHGGTTNQPIKFHYAGQNTCFSDRKILERHGWKPKEQQKLFFGNGGCLKKLVACKKRCNRDLSMCISEIATTQRPCHEIRLEKKMPSFASTMYN